MFAHTPINKTDFVKWAENWFIKKRSTFIGINVDLSDPLTINDRLIVSLYTQGSKYKVVLIDDYLSKSEVNQLNITLSDIQKSWGISFVDGLSCMVLTYIFFRDWIDSDSFIKKIWNCLKSKHLVRLPEFHIRIREICNLWYTIYGGIIFNTFHSLTANTLKLIDDGIIFEEIPPRWHIQKGFLDELAKPNNKITLKDDLDRISQLFPNIKRIALKHPLSSTITALNVAKSKEQVDKSIKQGQYVFEKISESICKICFNGTCVNTKNHKGFAIILYLLNHPQKSIHVSELYHIKGIPESYLQEKPDKDIAKLKKQKIDSGELDNESSSEMHSYSGKDKRNKKTEKDNIDRIYDDKYINSIKNDYKVKNEAFNDAEKLHDIDKMEKIDKERAILEDKIKEAVKEKNIRINKLLSYKTKRYYDGVRRNIKTALIHLQGTITELSKKISEDEKNNLDCLLKHLKDNIKTGSKCIYNPPKNIPWNQ